MKTITNPLFITMNTLTAKTKKVIKSFEKVVAITSCLFLVIPNEVTAQITFETALSNPFSISVNTTLNTPHFADLDNDGDQDLISGEQFGGFLYYQNTGTTSLPTFTAGVLNPFSLAYIGAGSSMSCFDIDNDGDMDLMAGSSYGDFQYFQNIGTAFSPSFDVVQLNPFSLTDNGTGCNPNFVDLDSDGDQDLITSDYGGNFHYYQNIGTISSPSYSAVQINPFSLAVLGGFFYMDVIDLDHDDDFDLLVVASGGDLLYYENIGSSETAQFNSPQLNPFSLTDIGVPYAPTFVDLDSDGDQDLMLGDFDRNNYYFENTTSSEFYDDDADGFTILEGDCDDNNELINPLALENCNGIDDNCDGSIDDGLLAFWAPDNDGDGYGDVMNVLESCSPPMGYITNNEDCDDTNASINIGAQEICDEIDNDCDGLIDDDDPSWFANPPADIQWQQTYGNGGNDFANAFIHSPDGGYLLIGEVWGYYGREANFRSLNMSGVTVEENTFGMYGQMYPLAGIYDESIDKYIIAGKKSGDAWNPDHFWFAALNATTLELDYEYNNFGGTANYHEVRSIIKRSTGGYVVTGTTDYTGAPSFHEDYFAGVPHDIYFAKVGTNGAVIWDRAFGSSETNTGNAVMEASDGDFIIAGSSNGNGSHFVTSDVTTHLGGSDFWVFKIDSATGNIEWQSVLGGSGYEEIYSMTTTNDGNYIVAGKTNSTNGQVLGNHGGYDFWIVKISSADGSLIWQKCLGGTGNEYAFDIKNTDDGGYIVTGPTTSTDGDVSGNHGSEDIWVVKLDEGGNLLWQKCLGGSAGDRRNEFESPLESPMILADDDDGYTVASSTLSNDGDVSDNNGGYDMWLAKLSAPATSSIWYLDSDNDGYGDPFSIGFTCSAPANYVSNNDDCNDTDINVNPLGTEICNEIDDNCDGSIDEGITVFWSPDNDGDGFGDGTTILATCSPPIGYVSNTNDCDDTNASIYIDAPELCDGLDNDCDLLVDNGLTFVTYYADTDADGFGDITVTVTACSAPSGFVIDGTDCDDTDALEYPGQIWYIDEDEDDWGTGTTIISCERPLYGFTSTELENLTGDCDDLNALINLDEQYFIYTGNLNYTSTIINPLVANPYEIFYFETKYIDATNNLPPVSYPRVLLDFENNGIYTDENDRTIIMTPADILDLNTADGKIYLASITGLAPGENWTSKIETNTACINDFGTFNYPDVVEDPDLEIFASDINFTDITPEIGDLITVTATIHNASSTPAGAFTVNLFNQFDESDYGDVYIYSLAANTSTTVSWDIITPSVDAWCPILVSVDVEEMISESNELDNTAVRPFINGDFEVPGTIIANATANPSITYNVPGSYVVYNGHAYYDGIPIELLDPSCAGAEVSFNIPGLEAEFITYTNSFGDFSIAIPVAGFSAGHYEIHGTITDFTLTGVINIVEFQIIIPELLPDLTATVNINEDEIIMGSTASGTIYVENIGSATTGTTTLLGITQSGGTPILSDIIIPILLPGESFSQNFSGILFNDPGSFSICVNVNADYAITESIYWNNDDCDYISVGSLLGDAGGGGGGGTGACDVVPADIHFTVSNSGNSATGTMNCKLFTTFNGIVQPETIFTVSTIPADGSVAASLPFSNYGNGTYYYVVHINHDEAIEESNFDNNLFSFTVYFNACAPNLVFEYCEGLDVTSIAGDYTGIVTFVANVLNAGDGEAIGPIDVEFSYDATTVTATYAGNIAAGAVQTITIDVAAPAIDNLLTAVIDPDLLIEETTHTDNDRSGLMCWDHAILGKCGPDFWEYEYNIFETVYPTAAIKSLDMFNTDELTVRFEIEGPGIIGTLSLGDAVLTDVTETCYSCGIPVNSPSPFTFIEGGEYTITMTVDPLNNFYDCEPANDQLVITINVNADPDMRVLSEFINPSELNPDYLEEISLLVTYENTGISNVGDEMELSVLVDEIPLSSVYPVPGLLNGDNYTVAIPVTWSSDLSGAHIIRAIIDSDEEIAESDEDDNESTRAVIVGASSNPAVEYIAANNYNPDEGEEIELQILVTNEGEQECNTTLKLYYITNDLEESLINSWELSLSGLESINVLHDWIVLDNSTTLIARLVNTSVIEYDYTDNEVSTIIGGFDVNLIVTDESCPDANDGIITAVITGGETPYSIAWSTGENGTYIIDAPGTYSITVTDNTGLTITESATINESTELLQTFYADEDGDGFGDISISVIACESPAGYVSNFDDCNDNNAEIHPSATEICDAIDNDCDGYIDEEDPSVVGNVLYYDDDDDDGFGDITDNPELACSVPLGSSGNNFDCDDTNSTINPDAPELCSDGTDNNCNGIIDELPCEGDADSDGFTISEGDCDDENPEIHPAAIELCDLIDNNCNGLFNEGLSYLDYYIDADSDGFGDNSASAVNSCIVMPDSVTNNSDCDDTNNTINPTASEICDAIDNNCDGNIDEGLIFLDYYTDADGDGFGDENATAVNACESISGAVTNNEDCDDAVSTTYPNSEEICNGIDENCNGIIDELPSTEIPTIAWDHDFGTTAVDNAQIMIEAHDGGFILGAYTNIGINGDKTQISRGNDDYWIIKTDSNGVKEWDFRFGGTASDKLTSIIKTSDGAYLLGGSSASGISGDKTESSRGNTDYWVIKINNAGTKIWDKRFGGSAADDLNDLLETTDGNYLLAGTSSSGITGDKSQATRGGADYWLVKINTSGTKLWDKRFGGTSSDQLYSVVNASDGGYILAGNSLSGLNGDKSQTSRGGFDYWILKTDESGTKIWDKRFGGTQADICQSITTTPEDDYLIAGESLSSATGDVSGSSHGSYDYWMVKINTSGTLLWNNLFGTNSSEDATDAIILGDNNYMITGATSAGINGDKSEASNGGNDIWMVKTDTDGDIIYDRSLGGNQNDYSNEIISVSDGGLAVLSKSLSGVSGDKSETTKGSEDFWIIKLTGYYPTTIFYIDEDNDGYGDISSTTTACSALPGYVADNTDCNDENELINPVANELCNGFDDNCNTLIDEGVLATYYADNDGDTYGNPLVFEIGCDASVGFVVDNSDCDDTNISVHPYGLEICNGLDDDCDALTDNDDPSITGQSTWYADTDADGFGNISSSVLSCEIPSGYVADNSDCDDSNAFVNSSITEICNSIDDDCDGLIDNNDPSITGQSTWYVDTDEDDFGDAAVSLLSCDNPVGYVADNTDCDDSNAFVNSSITEICNGIDDDCDGSIDNDDPTVTGQSTWYADTDLDTYGDASVSILSCEIPSGYVADNTDCDDSNASVNSSITEICNSIDDDCDGSIDNDDPSITGQSTWYVDADADGFGNTAISLLSCNNPIGYVADNTDCNDLNNSVHPLATEVCNLIDDDCDALIDEGVKTTFFADSDGDTFGEITNTQDACTAPFGYVSNNTDCNDANATINSSSIDICNDIDDDCDGIIDENKIIAVVYPNGTFTECQSLMITLTANPGNGLSYQWYRNNILLPGATSQTYNTTQNGFFKVKISNAFSCSSTSAETEVIRIATPSATISVVGGLDLCTTGSVTLQANTGVGLSYQWYRGGLPIAGATSNTYIATTTGNYKVLVVNDAGCAKNSSGKYVYSSCREITAYEMENDFYMNIYPNPAINNFNIELILSYDYNGPVEIELFDMTGNRILDFTTYMLIGELSEFVSIDNNISAGAYLLKINTGKFSYMKKIIIAK